MQYIKPEIKVSMFNAEQVRTDDPIQTLSPLSSSPNGATKSLEETLINAADGAYSTLVFKWN